MGSNATRIADSIRKLLVVPDKLVTAQPCLRPLSQGDLTAAPTEAMQPVADACELMHSAMSDVVELARNPTELAGIEGCGPLRRRFSVDHFYHRGL